MGNDLVEKQCRFRVVGKAELFGIEPSAGCSGNDTDSGNDDPYKWEKHSALIKRRIILRLFS